MPLSLTSSDVHENSQAAFSDFNDSKVEHFNCREEYRVRRTDQEVPSVKLVVERSEDGTLDDFEVEIKCKKSRGSAVGGGGQEIKVIRRAEVSG